MSRDKQIEEMAKIIAQSVDVETLCDGLAGDSSMACFGCDYSEKEYCKHHLESATGLYNKDYRKASDVAREIFEELEKCIGYCTTLLPLNAGLIDLNKIADLKKKYESEGADNAELR